MTAVPEGAVWVRLPRFIGDSIMIHRALEPLRAQHRILVAWGPAPVLELFEGTPYFAALQPDPPRKLAAWRLSRLLRAHAPGAVVNLARSQRANLAAWLGGVPLRIGWREGLGAVFCNRSRSFRKLPGHQQAKYEALLRTGFGPLPEAPFVPFRPGPDAEREAAVLLAGVDGPFVVFALGAMSWSKTLGQGVWSALRGALLGQGLRIVLLGAAGGDQARAKEIAEGQAGVCDLTGRASLAVGAAILRSSLGVVGNDSALCHLAAACGIPAVVAFGPTDPAVTAPLGEGVRVVRRGDLPCLACGRGACPVPGHPCMNDLPPEDLLRALEEVRLRPS